MGCGMGLKERKNESVRGEDCLSIRAHLYGQRVRTEVRGWDEKERERGRRECIKQGILCSEDEQREYGLETIWKRLTSSCKSPVAASSPCRGAQVPKVMWHFLSFRLLRKLPRNFLHRWVERHLQCCQRLTCACACARHTD